VVLGLQWLEVYWYYHIKHLGSISHSVSHSGRRAGSPMVVKSKVPHDAGTRQRLVRLLSLSVGHFTQD
jgi:hypothetical protein